MDISWRKISRSPVVLLFSGLLLGMVFATLVFIDNVSTTPSDPVFNVLSGSAGSSPALASTTTSSSTPEMPKAASLSALLPRLEAKVVAEPDNADLQILLARTYLELDQKHKGKELLDRIEQRFPQHQHLPFLQAKILMESVDTADLQKAVSLLEESVRRRPAASYVARLYQGRMLIRLGKQQQAIDVWRDYIGTLPPDDQRRLLLEAELEKVANAS
jgi:cytochrome c-type biogenesis protein CcmH/NrfG